MNQNTVNGWVLLSLLMSTLVYAYPQQAQSQPSHIAAQYVPKTTQQQTDYRQHQYLRQQQQQPQPHIQHYQVHDPAQWQQHQQQQQQQQQQLQQYRKYAEKPNHLKKVSLDDIDDDNQVNQIDSNAFSWTNMLGQVMQMIFANANNFAPPTKSDDVDGGNSVAPSWTNVLSAGLKIVSALLGGGNTGDGIDKVDNGNVSPVQSILTVVLSGLLGNKDPDQVNIMAKQAGEFISIVVNLLDALKTSFSHRSLNARSIGKKDSVSDLGIASITMLKGYVKTVGNTSEKCMQKYICEANNECNNDIGSNSIFCQLGSYATSFVLERQTGTAFEKINDAGRRGRQGDNCREIYVECSGI